MPMLRDLAERLTLPGMPEWSGLVALIVLLLAGCFLLMPFSVFGLKGRLDAIETQLDEMRAEIRALLARQSDARPPRDWLPTPVDDDFVEPVPRAEPPPPSRHHPTLPPMDRAAGRTEPRISWPKR